MLVYANIATACRRIGVIQYCLHCVSLVCKYRNHQISCTPAIARRSRGTEPSASLITK